MRRVSASIVVAAVLGLGFVQSVAWACESCPAGQSCSLQAAKDDKVVADEAAKKAPPFLGNATCPMMGSKTNPKMFVEYKDPKTHSYGKIHVCCAGCLAAVEKDPATAYKKAYLDRVVKDKKGNVLAKKGQPLDLKNATCPVMGGKVSPKSSLVYNGYKIGLCCADCEKAFLKSPDKNLAKLLKASSLDIAEKRHAAAPSNKK